MNRKIVIPTKPMAQREGATAPRERRKLGIRFDLMTGDAVSGLR